VKSLFKFNAFTLIGACLIFLVIFLINPWNINRYFRYKIRNILGISCIDYKQEVFSRKLRDIIPDYIENSSVSGIKKCRDKKEILERVAQGKLVEIKNGNGFFIAEMSHSYPYLTKNGKELLVEICRKFTEKISGTRLKGSRIKITSMTRTADKLKSLRGSNSNASLNSPHFYGNAFDMSYIRFSTRKLFLTNCDKKYLMEALAEVIWELKNENRCWATYELKQNCYHVVAR
jgi:hypothetical protein